jgi:RNA polymerase sigma-B factor
MSDQPHHATHDASRVAEDRALFARYLDQRDPVDRDMLVERFLPLARQLARRYQRPDEPFDDLFQVACLGLVNAIERFDLERDVAFSSYAVPTILGEIKRYFRDRTWSVRVPRDLQDLALKVERAVTALDFELHRRPTVDEIVARVGAREGTASGSRSMDSRPPRTAPRSTGSCA